MDGPPNPGWAERDGRVVPLIRILAGMQWQLLLSKIGVRMKEQRKLDYELCAAVGSGSAEQVRNLLVVGSDSNAETENSPPVLRTAIMRGDAEIVSLLVISGADVNSEWSCCPPLHLAITSGVCRCLECDPLCDCEFSFDRDVHHYLQAEGRSPKVSREILHILIDAGADVSSKNEVGLTALNLAVATGEAESVRMLVNAGADPHGADGSGVTPMEKVARLRRFIELEIEPVDEEGIADAIEWIIEPPDPMDFEVEAWLEEVTREERYKRAQRNRRRLRLFHAAAKGDVIGVKSLIIAGGDVYSATRRGVTPLHVAALNGHAETVRVLLWAGANVDARDASGQTPLYQVSGKGNTEIVRILLKSGADANATTNRGRTPLWFARRRGHAEIARMLGDASVT